MDLETFLAYFADIKKRSTEANNKILGDKYAERIRGLSNPIASGVFGANSKLSKFLLAQKEQSEKMKDLKSQTEQLKQKAGHTGA